MKDKFNQTYLQIIAQSARWQDSLGGKLVTGVGSLFKRGTKTLGAAANAAVNGLEKAADSSITSVKKFVKEYKTKSKILDAINNIKALYNPDNPTRDSIKNLIENKAQIKYIVDSSKLVLPPNLLKFLQIFQTVGSDIVRLIKENPSISSRSQEEIKALINQSLLYKVESFKESIESTITQEVTQNLVDIYYNIIIQQLSAEGEIVDDSSETEAAETEIDSTTDNSKQDVNLLKQVVQEFNKEYKFKIISEDKNIIKTKKIIKGSKILSFLSQNDIQLIWNQNESDGLEEYVNKIDILADSLTIEIHFTQNNEDITNKFRITSKLKNIDDQILSIQDSGPKINDGQLNDIIKKIAESIQKMYRHTEYSSFHKIAINNGFNGNNGIYQKHFSNLDLKSRLEKFTDVYEQIDDIVMADNLLCKIKIKNSNLQVYMKSEYYVQPVIIPVSIDDYSKLNENFNDILNNTFKQFYTQENKKQASQQERQHNLNNIKKQDAVQNNIASAYNDIRGVENVLIAANDSIENDIKWKGGLFGIGSFKKVLREIAACKLNIDDIKYLAKVFFQLSIIK